ncbi:MAG: amino acid permease [Sphingobium sp.]
MAVSLYMSWWFPDVPVSFWSVGSAAAVVWVNTRAVHNFGSVEYALTVIKVLAIIAFIIIGLSRILGVVGEPIGLYNVTGLPGGFMPHGLAGVWMAVLMALFSFIGLKFVVGTASEAKDPRTAIPVALRTMAARLFLFYLLALFVTVAFQPWTQSGVKVVSNSPMIACWRARAFPVFRAL